MTRISIIGLGLIGGSMALELKSQLKVHVMGVDSNEEHKAQALKLELVDEIIEIKQACKNSDFVILAIPVDQIENTLPEILSMITAQVTVIDVGSTKESICNAVKDHPNRAQYVAAHPLAGTEYSGPEAAFRGLFMNKKNIICEQEKSNSQHLDKAIQLFNSLGLNSYFLDAEEHDRHLAYVSHLSHVSSFTLGLTVLDIEKDENQIFNLAGTGFASTVRLAKSSPKTWAPIFKKNAKNLTIAIDNYIQQLENFKAAINQEQLTESQNLMAQANTIKNILNNV